MISLGLVILKDFIVFKAGEASCLPDTWARDDEGRGTPHSGVCGQTEVLSPGGLVCM